MNWPLMAPFEGCRLIWDTTVVSCCCPKLDLNLSIQSRQKLNGIFPACSYVLHTNVLVMLRHVFKDKTSC